MIQLQLPLLEVQIFPIQVYPLAELSQVLQGCLGPWGATSSELVLQYYLIFTGLTQNLNKWNQPPFFLVRFPATFLKSLSNFKLESLTILSCSWFFGCKQSDIVAIICYHIGHSALIVSF